MQRAFDLSEADAELVGDACADKREIIGLIVLNLVKFPQPKGGRCYDACGGNKYEQE